MVATTSIIALILAGIIIFVLLFYQRRQFLYKEQLNENAHANQLLKTRMEMQEQTLRIIGQELHDNIGQLLSTTKMFMGLAESTVVPVSQPFKTAKETLSLAIKEVRALSKSFNNEWLNRFNLYENLQQEVNRINSAGSTHVALNATNATLALESDAQIMLFRVIQEALQNCIKHANAKQICIAVTANNAQLVVNILDDGVGFNVDDNYSDGVGQLNMRHRTQLLGGTITWASNIGRGTCVHICIPLTACGDRP